jgi:hypothetical protein
MLKRLRKLQVNSTLFTVRWDATSCEGSFSYDGEGPGKGTLTIGTKCGERVALMILCHELMEIVAIEALVRFRRPDVGDDYIFVYDHRQHSTMMEMFAGLLAQFLGDGI